MNADVETPESARVSAGLLFVGLAVTLPPLSPSMRFQWPELPWQWSAACVGGVTLTLLCSALAWRTRRWPRTAARLLAATTALGLAWLAVGVAAGWIPPVHVDPWVIDLHPIAMAACSFVSARPWRVAAAAAACSLVTTSARWSLHCCGTQVVLQDAAFGVVMSVVSFAFVATALQLERSTLEAQADAVRAYARAREAEALTNFAVHWECFVHDEVLSVLGRAAAGEDTPALRTTAQRVIAQAAQPRAPGTRNLRDGIVEACLRLCPKAGTTFDERDPISPPPEVVEALLEAASEAMRNIDRHAFPQAGTGIAAVQMTHHGEAVEIVVTDSGVGFDRDAVPDSRLGIAVSIKGRMEAAGGRASVASVPGRGTTVTVRWPR